MSRPGERVINGRVLVFWERHTGLDARARALAQAKELRAAGAFVRIVKKHAYDYVVFKL